MALRFHRFDPTPCAFPRPCVPVLPTLGRSQLTWEAHAQDRPVLHFSRGRYALRAAYAAAGVGPAGDLLAPAYHCRTMLDPALSLGAPVRLYPLTPDLHPRVDELDRIADADGPPVAALLFTHYFGVPRDLAATAAWCRSRGIALIEDCSHALPMGTSTTVGRTGRYAVSSPYKFFPCPDGGLLWTNGGVALPAALPRGQGLKSELGALLDLVRTPATPRPGLRAAALDSAWQQAASKSRVVGREWVDPAQPISADYVESKAPCSSLAASRWIQRHMNLPLVVQRRRARYRQWVDAVAALPGCRALLPALPADAVPYMFALQVDEPARCFYTLKHLGMPIWRWDDMAVSDCEVSMRYRQGVFHLPCHQSLDDDQMAWMIAAIGRSMQG